LEFFNSGWAHKLECCPYWIIKNSSSC